MLSIGAENVIVTPELQYLTPRRFRGTDVHTIEGRQRIGCHR